MSSSPNWRGGRDGAVATAFITLTCFVLFGVMLLDEYDEQECPVDTMAVECEIPDGSGVFTICILPPINNTVSCLTSSVVKTTRHVVFFWIVIGSLAATSSLTGFAIYFSVKMGNNKNEVPVRVVEVLV